LATFAQIFGESFGNSAAEEEIELTEVAIKLYNTTTFVRTFQKEFHPT